MNQTQTGNGHTPGPWRIEPLQSIQGTDMAIVAAANGRIVAVIPHDPDIQEVDEPDSETVVFHDEDCRNARLLAAAPALVAQRDALAAALTEMLAAADMFREPYRNAAVCERAEAALAVKNPETQP